VFGHAIVIIKSNKARQALVSVSYTMYSCLLYGRGM